MERRVVLPLTVATVPDRLTAPVEGMLWEPEGGVYVACQWGECTAMEPYPAYHPPEGWGTHTGDWFCPQHLREARLEEGVEWAVAVPDGRQQDGYRRRRL